MGTGQTHRNPKKINCTTCGQAYTPKCNYRQGRCPHHASLLDIIMTTPYKLRFYNLINFLKGK
jgi:hypothetical protein